MKLPAVACPAFLSLHQCNSFKKAPVSVRKASCVGLSLFVIAGASFAQAQNSQAQSNSPYEEVVVFGRNTDLLGSAESASQGSVGGADLLVRPMVKVADVLESIPGMVAVQHSGSGKANQYFLRGFNLDHGTDFTVNVDGMPWNLRSHGHGQGYLDVNGLIPELIDRIDYRKGPYYADVGDFSLAGASYIKTIDRLEKSFVSVEAGEYDWQRFAIGVSQDIGTGTLTLVGETKGYDGPWENEENLKHLSFWGKYTAPTSYGQAAYTLAYYDATWNPTEQIPERAIGTSVCEDEFCALDSSADGSTERWISTAQFIGDGWNADLYLQHYDWEMESNPTYDFQINQFDTRYTIGGQFNKDINVNEALDIDVGTEVRYDDISDVGLDQHNNGNFIGTIADNDIQELSVGVYAHANWQVTEQLRLLGGVRGDYYDFNVKALSPTSADGSKTDEQLSPKIGAAYTLNDQVEVYGNWGRGFHSNDARGVVNEVDPVPGLSEGEGYEGGLRYSTRTLKMTAAYWWLDQDSELIFVGDANSVEPKGASEREGYELTLFWQPTDWLGIDAVYTESEARYLSNPEGVFVENAVEESGQIGFNAVKDNWEASIRMRYLGPYALVADNSARADSLTTVNLRGAYHWSALTFYAEVINLLDTDGKDITYDYPAFITGLDEPYGTSSEDLDCEAAGGCRMSRVTEPRTVRVGVSYKF